jgi:hypothetical protein
VSAHKSECRQELLVLVLVRAGGVTLTCPREVGLERASACVHVADLRARERNNGSKLTQAESSDDHAANPLKLDSNRALTKSALSAHDALNTFSKRANGESSTF